MNTKKLRRDLGRLREQKSGLGQKNLKRSRNDWGGGDRAGQQARPQWISSVLPESRPISIPGHKSIKTYTAVSILDCFEEDLARLEELEK